MQREILVTVGVSSSCKEFCCEEMQRNRVIGRREMCVKSYFLFKMGEMIAHLYANGNHSVEKEKMMLQEEREVVGVAPECDAQWGC